MPAAGAVFNPKGYVQDTTLSTVQTLTPPAGAIRAWIQAETQDVRWTDDGSNPTTTVGMLLKVNTVMEYEGDLEKFKYIEVAASAKLNISYYGL